MSGASRWAALAPRAVKLRSSSRPYPAVEWAADLDAAHAATRLPDVPGAVDYDELLRRWNMGDRRAPLSYAGWLVGQQSRVRTTRSGERLVTVGVRLRERARRPDGRGPGDGGGVDRAATCRTATSAG